MTRAIQLQPPGTVELIDVVPESLGVDEIRVAVTLAGVNFWEVLQRRGQVPVPAPAVVGSEGVGVVIECGRDADPALLGTRVAWSKIRGSYAEQVQGPAAAFTAVPDDVSDETAAGLLFQGVTAHYLANDVRPLGHGDAVAVTAAAGGVGLLLVQLLNRRGATVYGLTSSPEKAQEIRAAGATAVLDYRDAADKLRAAEPYGLSAVFDSVGDRLPRDLLPTLKARGSMILFGAASGVESDLSVRDLGSGSYFLTRTAGRDYAGTPQETSRRARELLSLAADGDLTVHVGGTWPLADAALALDALESRKTTGKLLLDATAPRS